MQTVTLNRSDVHSDILACSESRQHYTLVTPLAFYNLCITKTLHSQAKINFFLFVNEYQYVNLLKIMLLSFNSLDKLI